MLVDCVIEKLLLDDRKIKYNNNKDTHKLTTSTCFVDSCSKNHHTQYQNVFLSQTSSTFADELPSVS